MLFSWTAGGQDTRRILNNESTTYNRDTASISQLLYKAKSFRHKATDSGIALFQQALIQSRRINYTDGLARSLIGLGLSYMDKGEYNKSFAYYELAKPFCEASTFMDGVLIVALYNNIAALYGNRGVFDSAAQYYYKSLEEMEHRKIKDTNLLLLIYSNLGGRLVSDNQIPQGKFYMDKAKVIAKRTGNTVMLAKIYVDLAALHGTLKQHKESRDYAQKALELFQKIKDPSSELSANCIIGNTYLDQGEPEKALIFFKRAVSNDVGASRTRQAVALRGIGASYYELKDYPKAKQYYQDALNIARESKMNKDMMECYKALVPIYADLGNYRLALDNKNAYEHLKDSTVNAERINRVNLLEVRYRTAEKDKELAHNQLLIQQKENQIQGKNRLILTIAGGSALMLALLGTLYRNRKHRQNIQLITLEKEREIGQLKAMMEGEEKERTRIARELHDGIMVQFSSAQMNLSALIERAGLAHSNDMEQILEQLEDATKELRKSAHNLMPDMLLQEGIAEATHYFCKTLQRSSGIEIDFHLIGTMPPVAPEYELMLYRIIQELVQNAIKHARASHILVQINCHPDMISIVVEDNGIGFDKDLMQGYNGMGLKGIGSRIHSLKGNISFTSQPGTGTSVYLEIETRYLVQNNAKTNYNSHNG